MMKNRLSLLAVIFLTSLFVAKAQVYYFKHYEANDGVSSNTITAILQDKKGFMWFGSRNGLNRFDGNNFRIYRHQISDANSLGSNSILSLYEDPAETLWVGTTKGIYLYNPKKETFTPFKLIPKGEVRAIKGDSQQNIWIISDFTLYKYHQPTAAIDSFEAPDDDMVGLHISSENVWAASGKGLIYRYNKQTRTLKKYDLQQLSTKGRLTRVQEIYSIGDSLLMIGTLNHAYIYNPDKKTLKDLFINHPSIKEVQVHTMMQQSPTELWLGTETGMFVYNTITGKAIRIQKELYNPYSLSDNVIFSFYKDREGNTWIGTFFGGINYYSKQYNRFQKYFPQPGKSSLSGNLVHEITRDDYGNLWVGTEDAGLNKIDLNTGIIKNYLPGDGSGLSYANIHGLLANGNELWIGTYEHGLDVMDIRTGKVIRHYDASTEDEHSLKSNFIVTIYKTRKGQILIGTWLGMFAYNRKDNNFEQMKFFNTQVQAIHEDSSGMVWASTYGNGVYFYNPLTGKGGYIRHNPENKSSLINNYVNNLFEDSHHNIWFSTEGGLTRYERNGKFTHYTIESGFPDNQVFKVQEDNMGYLWISTSKGLVRMNPANKNIQVFKTTHGLLTDQFNYNSAYKHTDGCLFFGTAKGLISYDPKAFNGHSFIPPVYITGIQVNGKDLTVQNSSLTASTVYAQQIRLPYDSSNISFDVAALSYNTPEMNAYLYKMEGFDKNWTLVKSNRKIYYTKLPPGEYVFRVKGSSGNGGWNEAGTQLNIRITPPLWATTGAYLFYFLVSAGIIFIILRYYYIALNARNKRKIDLFEREKEREIYNAKIDFFTNIAHEIRTPLTLIKMPLDKLIRQESYNEETKESLYMIEKNTNRLINLTNQLLDFRKAEANNFSLTFTKTDINELMMELYTLFQPAADQKGIQFKLDMPRMTLHAYVDEEAFKKIVVNLMNNAIKYSETKVHVKLLPFSSEDEVFHIEFRNDGHIIPKELGEKIFEPFFRLQETEKEEGTGIGLPLAKALAELHNGSLQLKNTNDNTNLFLLSIPIHQVKEFDLIRKEDEENEEDKVLPPSNTDIEASKPAILLVEDNKEILTFIKRELASEYAILTALNGQEALQILAKENVQLVISDIMMPVMDGIELCRHIKTDLQYSHVPIILLTAKNSLQSRIEGLEVGADAYIEKPFAFEHLQAQITNLIANRNILKQHFASSPLTHLKGIAHSPADKTFIEELNTVIYDNITNMDLDVDQLAKMMNMSRPTLYRKIKALSDLSPNELINLTRLKKAAELLSEGKYKINEVANLIGYTIPANFSRDFSRQFGVTPSAYVGGIKDSK